MHETEFGPLSAKFGVRDVLAVGHSVFAFVGAVVVRDLPPQGQQVPFGVASGQALTGLTPGSE